MTSRARYTLVALSFSTLWASAFIAIKIAIRHAPPLTLQASRFLVAGVVLLAVARLLGRPIPWRAADWRAMAILGVLNNACYLGITTFTFLHLSAGMGAVLASTNPLMLALVAPWALGERLTARRAAGLAVSYAGVVWVMWSRIGDDNRPEAIALFAAAIGFIVAATIVFKRLRPTTDRLVLNGGQCVVAGVVLAVPSLVFESFRDVHWSAEFLAAQAYLIGAMSWLAMLLWFWLLDHGDATRASAWFFLNPILGLVLAAVFLAEPLGALDLLGAAAVGAGIWLVQRG